MLASTTSVTKCALFFVLCVAVAAEKSKKLRNVIITSFGELPYEPMTGFFQPDVIPVDLNDESQQQTMDVALRTGILVEDPNEKKKIDVEGSEEDEASYTNVKRQVSSNKSSKEKETTKETNGESTSLYAEEKRHDNKRNNNPEFHEVDLEKSDKYLLPPRNFGYDSRQSRKQKSQPSTTFELNTFNLNKNYDAELGEGWNLQSAEEVLQGRNYNILTHNRHRIPSNYPVPPPLEIPPPLYPRHPMFYPFPSYGPYPPPPKDAPTTRVPILLGYSKGKVFDEDSYRETNSGTQVHERRPRKSIQVRSSAEHRPVRRDPSFNQMYRYHSEDYLRGI